MGVGKVRDNSSRRREVRRLWANVLPPYIEEEITSRKGAGYAKVFRAYVDGDKTCMEIAELCHVPMGHVSFAVGECLKIARSLHYARQQSDASSAGSSGSVDDGDGVVSSHATAGARS